MKTGKAEELVVRYLALWDDSGACEDCEAEEALCADKHELEQFAIVEAMRAAVKHPKKGGGK